MKLSTRDAVSYFARPDPDKTGILIYGADAMRVALKRQQLLAALLGKEAEEEMRLTRLNGGDLRKDPALLLDAVKAVGFFPGPRAAFVQEANENSGPAILTALADWQSGDAQIIVTAGALKPTSKLRKAFEAHPNAYAAGIYDNPPTRAEIETTLAETGLALPTGDVMAALSDLAEAIDPGDFRQTIEKLSLYKLHDPAPISLQDIAACAPTSTEADVDDVLMVVAEARAHEIGPMMQKLIAQGANPVGLCIGAMRHFRALHRAACDTSGRPTIFGPNRDRMLAQSRKWGAVKLETALTVLTDTDLKLRSAGQHAPGMALVERAFIRLAMLAPR
ncbi:DNA polymerase III subunit delta [Roseobacter sp. OBYS 0001]|uniref:DNA polymerase III subunit delta n=1 Tax=Roseobacter sp. OBYS 0001 TaxID=882651 RepID=UPI001BC0E8A8|nr:DNA polymerase III subunit delta [Roseobacter sp. OBYS 0001]GIT88228.1 DNA polymerase III subunit delta [Roseobacter sp. OBYS 0001]